MIVRDDSQKLETYGTLVCCANYVHFYQSSRDVLSSICDPCFLGCKYLHGYSELKKGKYIIKN